MKLHSLALLFFIGNRLVANDLGIDQDSLSISKIITPNNDGINDALTFDFEMTEAELSIYNRWGTLVYQSAATKSEWNGIKITGDIVPSGVYFYILKGTLSSGESIEINNSVSVLR